MAARTAFIGTGIMGAPMAGHLLNAGNSLVVNSRTKARVEELIARGAKWANSPKEAAASADFVFVCVNDTPDVEKVILGKDGVVEAARAGLMVVDHSTISPSATKKMAEALRARGAVLLDAPVSGGDVGAKNATLSIMVGGDEEAFKRAQPLLAHMGKTIVHCGPSGYGQLTKLVNQILVSVTLTGVAEAMAFAAKNGLDLAKTLSVVSGGAAKSWQLENLGPKMVAHDFRPGFMIDLMQKDLRLVMQSGQESGCPLAASALVHQLFTSAQAQGHGRDGTQAIFAVMEGLANLKK
ncbi:MAG TPA: NAD(P)-dependent oxidoreductase [Tepidisphaeraceae bacterium]|jgi:3-hydroxyisobutyrate dehydrogenase|nr:NAD(P)-dependent oxidoreductase [Tepidisphaeraceae bacterium]